MRNLDAMVLNLRLGLAFKQCMSRRSNEKSKDWLDQGDGLGHD